MDALTENWDIILDGFLTTLRLLAGAGALALVIGTVIAMFRVSPVPVLRRTGAVYVAIFRNSPLLVLLLVTYYGLPQLGINPSFYWKIILAMGLYTGAFVAESLRSGINGIPLGQAEASRSLGFTFGQSMTQVVLPQAFRNVVPPLASVFIALTKNTSLAMSFGIAEAAFRMKGLINDYATERWTIFIGIALGYIIIVETISFGAAMLERRWRAER
ncbi:amino acid ABC transporter permease [Mumia sp. zg.B53]|uniref:amino acid ABC transporter permease n=1 Tax=unclassified Mumia TaxID=2621872 RepID=UPI001C6E5EFA|nr:MULTISPECIES: amino acid ABC transporter permease [unclassified Mumia]MBW9205422.1 amino acid ABC transporter permease [Mumia sp. zg.B17]MBW9216535.1 amino acid ABC transporter permease [Mumia sp. zg.B53]